MAEEEEEAAEGEEPPPPDEDQPSRLPQFLILIVVILLGQAAAAYVLITKIYWPGMLGEEDETTVQSSAERPVFEIDQPLLFSLNEMILNPPNDQGLRFLSAAVTIELDEEAALLELEGEGGGVIMAQIHDLVFASLNSTPFDDMDEAVERQRLRVRLKEEINAESFFEVGEILNIYFDRFVLQ